MNRKMKSNPQVRTMSRGTKIFTYICLAWAVLVALMPLVWLFISSLKKDPLARLRVPSRWRLVNGGWIFLVLQI